MTSLAFSHEGNTATHHHTASIKSCYPIGAAIRIVFSTSSLQFESMIGPDFAYGSLSLNIMFFHIFRCQCKCCRHQCKGAWPWRAVMAGLLAALLDGSVKSFLDYLGRELLASFYFYFLWAQPTYSTLLLNLQMNFPYKCCTIKGEINRLPKDMRFVTKMIVTTKK